MCLCGAQELYAIVGPAPSPITVNDAPYGCAVLQMKCQTWLASKRIPIDIFATYNIRGYTKWLGDGDPGKYYATVYAYNAAGDNIGKDGLYFFYFESAIQPRDNTWIVHELVCMESANIILARSTLVSGLVSTIKLELVLTKLVDGLFQWSTLHNHSRAFINSIKNHSALHFMGSYT
jgi:hypothetical protein